MKTYHFTILVRDADSADVFLDDLLYEAGCDDALICRLNNIVYLEFDRLAIDAKLAISSAFKDLNTAGFYDLVLQEKGVSSLAEMAQRLGVSRMTFSHYANAKRGSGNFPKPVAGVISGSMLYAWHEVATWLYKQNKLSQTDYEVAQVASTF